MAGLRISPAILSHMVQRRASRVAGRGVSCGYTGDDETTCLSHNVTDSASILPCFARKSAPRTDAALGAFNAINLKIFIKNVAKFYGEFFLLQNWV